MLYHLKKLTTGTHERSKSKNGLLIHLPAYNWKYGFTLACTCSKFYKAAIKKNLIRY